MRKYIPLFTVTLSALLSFACDSGSTSGDDAAAGSAPISHAGAGGAPATGVAGSMASGGSSGAHTAGAGNTAGAPGTAGAANTAGAGNTGGLILGSGGPFAFPQNKKPANCSLTTVAGASASTQAAYNSWKAAFVTSNGAGAGLRVLRNGADNNDTVSEGIGYGMIAAVYMNDKATFDGLFTYAKLHFDADGLMTWHLDANGGSLGMGSATDGDEDMAWALVMASDQWSSQAYLADAKAMITAMITNSVASDGTLRPGDTWGAATTMVYPDYFAPSYYRVFAKVTNNPNWSGVIIDRNYTILSMVSGTHGLVPDSTNSPAFSTSVKYSYDACRAPWRIAMDYCANAEPRAKAYIDKIGAFFNGIGASGIGDGYDTASGTATSNNHNMAFIGPAGVAGMVGYPTLLDAAFTYGANNSGGDNSYFGQSLRVVTMLMMSGNFVDYTKP